MFVQLFCKDRNQKEKDELYQVLGLLAQREEVQIEERADVVELDVCPQGIISVYEEDRDVILSANTRHAGPGFHAFCVDLFMDLRDELNGEFELTDDLEFDKDGNFHRLVHLYEDEAEYLKHELLQREPIIQKNYLYDTTYFLPMEQKEAIATPVGYIDQKELSHLEGDALMDAFYVWNEWDKNARYYKNAALTLLAKEGMGEYLKTNHQSEKIAHLICDYIELAYKNDAEITLPLETYRAYCALLDRENLLTGARKMKEEVFQYRLKEVYHLFENIKVVAPGACERSYDPVTQSLCLMSPRTDEAQWDYLIQVSKQKDIIEDEEAVRRTDPVNYRDASFWIHAHKASGFTVLEAIQTHMEEELYFHCVLADDKDLSYLMQCIKESEMIL